MNAASAMRQGLLALSLATMLMPAPATARFRPDVLVWRATAAILALASSPLSYRLIYHPYTIPSEAMKPTLLIGDYVLVQWAAPQYQRGDVVVFRHPVNGQDYIKRLIGLPGDRIQMRDGLLYINDAAAPQTAEGQFAEIYEPQGPMGNSPRCENAPVGLGGTCTRSQFIETLPNGVMHDVLNIDKNGHADDTDVFTVPDGMYFFMGDNRDNSLDSRYGQASGGVGFVPAENLKGRADFVLFSSQGKSWWDGPWRPDRYFRAIQ